MPEKIFLYENSADGNKLAEQISKCALNYVRGTESRQLSNIISRNLRIHGVGFLGVLVENSISENKNKFLSILKNALSQCTLDGVKMWVRTEDLTGKFVDENFVYMLRMYRECHPYNVLLIYDPNKALHAANKEQNGFYTIDFDGLMLYEKNRLNCKS